MMDLSLSTHTRRQLDLIDLVLTDDSPWRDSFVVTPADPIPPRRLAYPDPDTVVWEQDGPTFSKVKRVRNWGWLRRQRELLVHPAVGTAFYVRTWRYRPNNEQGNRLRTGGIVGTQRFSELLPHSECILIARLSDGRMFAEAWASRSVLYDALSRWRNVQGYLVDWQDTGMHDPPTCAIGGADWKAIPELIATNRERTRVERERKTA